MARPPRPVLALAALAALAAVAGCGPSSSAPPASPVVANTAPPKSEPPPPPPRAAAANTFADVKSNLARVTSVTFVKSGEADEVVATLAPADIASIITAVRRCEPIDGFAATPPPYRILLRLSAEGDAWYLQLTAGVLRMDSAEPLAPSLASMRDPKPTVADCALGEGDDSVVWDIHERYLGPTKVKSYQPPPGSPFP